MTKNVVATNCLHVEIGYGGNARILIGRTISDLRVNFDAGEQAVISRGPDGLLVLSVHRATDEPGERLAPPATGESS